MKMRFLKLPVATILSMGLLLTVATGTTLASEEGEGGSFGDHQEMVVSVYDGDVVDFSSAVEPENLSGLKKMVKSGGEDDTIQVSAETLSDGRITISRPVNLYVDGYDSLSGADQDKVKLVIDLPDELEEDAARVMTIQGLPEECVLVRNLGPVSLYVVGTDAGEVSEPAKESIPADQNTPAEESTSVGESTPAEESAPAGGNTSVEESAPAGENTSVEENTALDEGQNGPVEGNTTIPKPAGEESSTLEVSE